MRVPVAVTESDAVAVCVAGRVGFGLCVSEVLAVDVFVASGDALSVIVFTLVFVTKGEPEIVVVEVPVFDTLILFDTVAEFVEVFDIPDRVCVGDTEEVFVERGDFV